MSANYFYDSNVDTSQRFSQFQFLLDGGGTGLIVMGRSYTLTDAEVGRCARYITMVPGGAGGSPQPGGGGGGGGDDGGGDDGGGGAVEVTISGTPSVGQTLTCSAPDGATFQWRRASTSIPGATSATYVVGQLDQGKTVTCVASIPSNGLDVPGAPLTMAVFGDSFAGSVTDGIPDLDHNFASLTATALSAELANGPGSFAHGGARNWLNTDQIATQVYQKDGEHYLPSGAPYAPSYPINVLMASINNLNQDAIIADLTIVGKLINRGINHLQSGGVYETLDDEVWGSFTGTWEDIPTTDANSGTGVKRAEANGSTGTLTTPSDFPGPKLRVYGPALADFGAVISFTVDGVSAGSVDARGATIQGGSQVWEKELTVSAGTHTVVMTISSISSVVNINAADFTAAERPLVVVMGPSRAPTYPGGEHTTTDTDVLDLISTLQDVVDAQDDLSVVFFDMDAVLAPGGVVDHDLFGPDQIHPNVAGHAAIAEALSLFIQDSLQALSDHHFALVA